MTDLSQSIQKPPVAKAQIKDSLAWQAALLPDLAQPLRQTCLVQ